LAPEDRHHCPWREKAEALQTQLDAARTELEALREKTSLLDERVGDLTQKLFGKRSERQRVTSVTAEINKRRPSTAAERKAKRAATAAAKAKIESVQERPPMPAARCHCEYCGDGPQAFLLVGSKTSTVYSMPPPKPIKRVTTRDTWACHCGKTMVSAPAPKRFGRSQYDASVVAHLIVGKCTDALPVARQAEQMKRQGVPSSRATLNRIFLRGGTLLAPMANWIMRRIASSELVLGDETPIRQQDQDGKGYFWVFSNGELTAYVYSPNRSGDTPKNVLGDSKGDLVVDGYTGYNQVTTPEKRRRSGCNAHARRKFCEAKPKTPGAQEIIDLYNELFVIEFDAQQQGIAGTAAHLEMRQRKSAPIVEKLYERLHAEQPRHLPKGKMGEAIRYAINNRAALTRFLTNPKIPISNNESERNLRVIALGRKNYQSVGNASAGERIAALYTITACCKRSGVEPVAYLTDVLERLEAAPDTPIELLLPDRWKPSERQRAADGG
jgi:transposase